MAKASLAARRARTPASSFLQDVVAPRGAFLQHASDAAVQPCVVLLGEVLCGQDDRNPPPGAAAKSVDMGDQGGMRRPKISGVRRNGASSVQDQDFHAAVGAPPFRR
jgi:hypothetical protein